MKEDLWEAVCQANRQDGSDVSLPRCGAARFGAARVTLSCQCGPKALPTPRYAAKTKKESGCRCVGKIRWVEEMGQMSEEIKWFDMRAGCKCAVHVSWCCAPQWSHAGHVLGQQQRNKLARSKHARRTARASSIDEKGLIVKSKATSAPPRAGTTGIQIQYPNYLNLNSSLMMFFVI